MNPPRAPEGEHQQRRRARQQRNRRIARVAGVGVGVALIGSSVLQKVAGGYGAASVLLLWLLLLLSVGCVTIILVTRGWNWQRMRARLAQEVRTSDRRPPVLYLRPFEVDERKHWYEKRI